MPPKNIKEKSFNLWPILTLLAGIFIAALICFYGANVFLDISWLTSLGSSRNISVVMFRVGLVPVFALVFAGLAVVHSWFGSSRERHNKGFLAFKFFFFFIAVCVGESFLRISETFIYTLMAGSTGVKDSLFNIDMALYLFWIPLIKKVSLFLMCYFILLFIFRISYPGDHRKIAYGKASLCLFSLFSIIFLLIAYSQYLVSRRVLGVEPFLGYADIFGHMIPLAISLIWTWLFLALGLYFLRRRYKALVGGSVITFIVLLACNVIWPFYLEKFILEPNKIAYQNKYAGIHAENTRKAFGLDALDRGEAEEPSASGDLSLQNMFLLDKYTLLEQLQNSKNITGALTFLNVAPSMLKEQAYYISPRTLSSQSEEWELRHFRNIHGFGAVVASASQTDGKGAPAYGVPPYEGDTPGDLPLDNPEIFFDESFEDFAFINTKMPLPNYRRPGNPLEEKTFTGVESIGLSFLHRIALAVSQRDLRPLLTKYYTPDTKLIYYRKPSVLAKKIMPFFDYSEPKPVYFNKALWWEMDGYISSEDVFVAASVQTPWGPKNWLRAPIRVYVNAYSGEVFFSRMDKNDPVVKVISKVFSQLFTKQITPETVAYPDILFSVQSILLQRYHETDAQNFYAASSFRSLSGETEPVILSFSGGKTIALSQNYNPPSNLGGAARLLAHIDENGNPRLSLSEIKGAFVDAAQAAEAIRVSAELQNLTGYWRTLEISAQFGNLVSQSYSGGVVYFSPIYTNSASLNMPVLATIASLQGSAVALSGNTAQLAALHYGALAATESLSSEQLKEQALRDAYLYYLEAEKFRVQGKPQDYQNNVDKLGERLRRALN